MKKLLITFFVLFFTMTAYAIDWQVADKKTVTWDKVTTHGRDNIIPAGDKIEYELYLVVATSTDRDADKTLEGTTEALEFTYVFTGEGKWFAGIRAVRTPQGETDKSFSEIVWSDDDDQSSVPIPFGFIHFGNPSKPPGFKPK